MKSLLSILFLVLLSVSISYGQESHEPSHEMNKFLAMHLKYPTEARENDIQGMVVVQTTFDESGNPISSALISGDPILGNEVLKTVQKLNKEWKSEYLGDKIKNDTYLMNFQFKLSKSKPLVKGIYLGPQKPENNSKSEISPLENISRLIQSNPYNSNLYTQRAAIYHGLDLPILAKKDLLLADYFNDHKLTDMVVVGYGYQKPKTKLGSSE